ncbi:hypothetical protein LUW76_03600 [Actinomadura madurae]|uniref:hypothetical protein n=2 Tax=Thermomonosporaceae TaxID=2012 RepID=UPI0020273CFA|nr:hypothetical protein [Actinomadura madurae]MCP9947819.1 hypothetical protein [Actinomadura madurae]URM93485.1 hypothetical protein LUW76_03600 [Actinomadura madurae]URN04207.1 hypothetical protein LUW74_13345 [Actinomadura madurae]
MSWVSVSVSLGFAGMAVLAWCAFKVWLGVRRFGRELERTRRRLEPKQSALRDELSRLDEARSSQPPGEGVRSS